MAAPVLQTQGTVAAVTTGNLVITLPAYLANDIVVITSVGFVPNTTTGTNTQSLDSPWTKNSPNATIISGGIIDEEHACWWARATSNSSLGSTVTITRPASWDTGTDGVWAGRAYIVRGCLESGNPFDEFSQTALTSIANPVLPAITVSGGNRLAIVFMTKADNTAVPTAATGYTVGTAAPNTTGTDCNFQTYRQTASANISTVTPTGGTANAANNGNSAYFEFAFIPAPVTATASSALGGLSGSGIATVKHLASASSSFGTVTGSANAVVITPSVSATGSALLGGLGSSAIATVSHIASANAGLGAGAGLASAKVEIGAVGQSVLGGLVSSAVANVSTVVVGSASLGGLSSSAVAGVTHFATGSVSLDGLESVAVADVTHLASGSSGLGGLVASAVAVADSSFRASASLGGLSSSASATVDPSPSPPVPQYPGGNPWYRRPKVEQVQQVEEVVVEPLRVPLQVFGVGASVGSLSSSAVAEVTWSILEDEAELLLLV